MKLDNLKPSSKSYQHILKALYNGRKIPIIPPLLLDGKLDSDFTIKADHSNNVFFSVYSFSE